MAEHAHALDEDALRRVVDDFAGDEACPTVAWGVVLAGDLAAAGSVGPVTERTVYRVASMTKSFSAAATLQLRDDGLLRLDDPITDHAPELDALRRTDVDSAPITIRDLLTMTSGLPTDDPWADRHLDLTDDEFDDIITGPPMFAFPTGQAFEYSNFGFALLGRVVHRRTGERIQQIITDRLLEPLGMSATTWSRPHHDDWARPMRSLDGAFVDEAPPLGDGLLAPMGGLWTDVTDLATWVAWMDDAFPARRGPDDVVLSRAARREMQSPHRYIGLRTVRGVQAPANYGLGLVILDEPEQKPVVTHSGGLPGYGSNMRWLPGRRAGVIALSNVTYAPMAELTALLLDEVVRQGFGTSDAPPVAVHLRDAADRLVALLNAWDDAAATQLFTESLADDDPFDRRSAQAAELIQRVGPLTITDLAATTGARGSIRCSRTGDTDVSVSFLIAPVRPSRIQSYEITSDVSPDQAG